MKRILIVIGLAVLVGMGIFFVIYRTSDTTDNAALENYYTIIKITIAILGVFAGAFAAAVSYNKHVLDEASKTAERFTKALELLGSDDIAVRIGSMYAFEKLAEDSEADRARIVEVLCTYLREKRHIEKGVDLGELPRDLVALAKIVCRVNRWKDIIVDFSYNDLHGANLQFANLRGANLRGANLSYAILGSADLSGANLSGANLSYTNLGIANLSGAILDGANLSHTDLGITNLSGASLYGANLHSANLSGSDLSSANLRNTDLRIVLLMRANLTGAKYEESQLTHTMLDETTILRDGSHYVPK